MIDHDTPYEEVTTGAIVAGVDIPVASGVVHWFDVISLPQSSVAANVVNSGGWGQILVRFWANATELGHIVCGRTGTSDRYPIPAAATKLTVRDGGEAGSVAVTKTVFRFFR